VVNTGFKDWDDTLHQLNVRRYPDYDIGILGSAKSTKVKIEIFEANGTNRLASAEVDRENFHGLPGGTPEGLTRIVAVLIDGMKPQTIDCQPDIV
jgi:hypothetical protein